jgi:hypothetical protein
MMRWVWLGGLVGVLGACGEQDLSPAEVMAVNDAVVEAPTGASGAAAGTPCGSLVCQNAGTCREDLGFCECPIGFYGPDCSRSVCEPNPCKHGACVPSMYSGPVKCSCEPGWEGLRCGVDIDECRTNNGGCDPRTTCTNVPGGRECGSCPPGFVGTGATGCQPASCVTAVDCEAAFGATPGCAAWQCIAGVCASAPACVDADADGLNAFSACGCGPVDCDDHDPHVDERERCYTGHPGTLGVGICRGGERRCVGADGAGHCSGEVLPSPESCNGSDDDCNGAIDDGLPTISCGLGACRVTVPGCTGGAISACEPLPPLGDIDGCNAVDDDCDGAVDEDCEECVHVAPDGDDDAAAAMSGTVPFATVQAAIDFASQNALPRVCVAAGATCGEFAAFSEPPGATLTMRDGVDVLGGYESTTFTRCQDSVTVLAPVNDLGVYFPPSIEGPVRLDGFTITPYLNFELPFLYSSAVTVDGARGVVLSNLKVTTERWGEINSGFVLLRGADAVLVRSTVRPEYGPAVRAVASRITIEQNCVDLRGGHCFTTRLPDPLASRSSDCSVTSADGFGVLLEDSPNSRVAASALCGGNEQDLLALYVSGDATGTVVDRNGIFQAPGSDRALGAVQFESCGDATPWLFENSIVRSGWGSSTRGVASLGTCSPVIDSNRVTSTGGDLGTVSCRGSACVVSKNHVTMDTPNVRPSMNARGIECDGGCQRVERNTVTRMFRTLAASGSSKGLLLAHTGAFVDRNQIEGACLGDDAGILALGSWSRIQNNVVTGGAGCRDGSRGPALSVVSALDGEVDVHSNRFHGGVLRAGLSCAVKRGAALSLSGPLGSSFGRFRNNDLVQGPCADVVVLQAASGTFSRFQNNHLAGSVLFEHLATAQRFTDIALVNALAGASGNRSDGVLENVGTTAGAPAYDFAGSPRDPQPDIGAFEAP